MRRHWLRPVLAATLAALAGFAAPLVGDDEAPARIVAVGDVHGAYDSLVGILRVADLVDAQDHWAGGSSVLVQTGDVLDRGADVDRVVGLLRSLQDEASLAGGRVEVLLGNHEQMNLLSDFRDVAPETFAAFAGPESTGRRERAWEDWVAWLAERAETRGAAPPDAAAQRERWLDEHPLGFFEYQEALAPAGRYGAWLRSLRVTLRLDGVLFMHAGLGPEYVELPLDEIEQRHAAAIAAHDRVRQSLAEAGVILPFFTLDELNALVRLEAAAPRPGPQFAARRAAVVEAARLLDELQELLLAEAPLWYRGYSKLGDAELRRLAGRLALVHGVRHVVAAHSPSDDATIHARLQGAFFLIDTGMLEPVYRGRPSALEIARGRFTAIYPESRHVLLEVGAEAALAGRTEPVGGIARPPLRPRLAAWQEVRAEDEAPEPAAPAPRWQGPDGAPLPFTDEDQVEEFLRTATIVEIEDIPEGVTKPQKVLLEQDGVRAHAAFRYFHDEGRGVKLADGTSQMFFLDSFRNEVAAYELARLLDMRNLPPAVLREVNGKDGSLQLWIENAVTQKKRQAENIAMPSGLVPEANRQTADMDIFDNLINNTDRNAGNILWGPDWRLWLVDHTRAFARSTALVRENEVTRCSRPLWEAIRGLDEATVRERLAPYLGTFEIRSLLTRRERLVERLEKEIESRGESAVIFTPGEDVPAVAISYDESK